MEISIDGTDLRKVFGQVIQDHEPDIEVVSDNGTLLHLIDNRPGASGKEYAVRYYGQVIGDNESPQSQALDPTFEDAGTTESSEIPALGFIWVPKADRSKVEYCVVTIDDYKAAELEGASYFGRGKALNMTVRGNDALNYVLKTSMLDGFLNGDYPSVFARRINLNDVEGL